MNGRVSKQLRKIAKMIEANPQYSGVPFKTIYKSLKRNYKKADGPGNLYPEENKRDGVN